MVYEDALPTGQKTSEPLVSPAAAQLIHLLTYVPPTDTHFDPETRTELLEHVNVDMAKLLRLDFGRFWSTVLYPNEPRFSVSSFLESYLRFHATSDIRRVEVLAGTSGVVTAGTALGDLVEAALAHKAFQIILRITTAPNETVGMSGARWSPQQWAGAIWENKIVTIPWLMDVARLYAHANPAVLRNAFTTVLKEQPRYFADLSRATEMIIETVHRIQKKYEKAASGKGKGKGKGKASTPSGSVAAVVAQSTGPDGSGDPLGPGGNEAQDPAVQDMDFLTDAVKSFEALVVAGGEKLADVVLGHAGLLPALAGAYEVANIIEGSCGDESAGVPSGLAAAVLLGEASFFSALNATNTIPAHARRLKLATLALLNSLIKSKFFEPMRLSIPEMDPITQTASGPPPYEYEPDPDFDIHARSEQLCDFVLALLELSPFDGPVVFLANAPLLVDLEVQLGIAERISALRGKYLVSDDDARLDYISVSLEHLLAFSGNAETRRILVNALREKMAMDAAAAGETSDVLDSVSSLPTVVSAAGEEYIKRSSLISHVQELFPELGEGFIEACLIAFNDDYETVIMKILENDLPDVVNRLDRNMSRTSAPPMPSPIPSITDIVEDSASDANDETAPSLLADRRNVFDGDEFDVFTRRKLDADKVIVGKKDKVAEVLQDRTFMEQQKESILQVQYDSYDDEYDDTYDSTDIKLAGTVELHLVDEVENLVDTKSPTAGGSMGAAKAEDPFARFEADLVALYQSDPSVFDVKQRKSAKRANLRERTGLADEQIEGPERTEFWRNMNGEETRRMMLPHLPPRLNERARGEMEEDAVVDEEEAGTGKPDGANWFSRVHILADKKRWMMQNLMMRTMEELLGALREAVGERV
ncbi:Activating signal cointegrator 1 complex subunit 2, partial [Borealophlyctis nickersoniae]